MSGLVQRLSVCEHWKVASPAAVTWLWLQSLPSVPAKAPFYYFFSLKKNKEIYIFFSSFFTIFSAAARAAFGGSLFE